MRSATTGIGRCTRSFPHSLNLGSAPSIKKRRLHQTAWSTCIITDSCQTFSSASRWAEARPYRICCELNGSNFYENGRLREWRSERPLISQTDAAGIESMSSRELWVLFCVQFHARPLTSGGRHVKLLTAASHPRRVKQRHAFQKLAFQKQENER
jgi:hypothetical protein